jgi:hypothetical protein
MLQIFPDTYRDISFACYSDRYLHQTNAKLRTECVHEIPKASQLTPFEMQNPTIARLTDGANQHIRNAVEATAAVCPAMIRFKKPFSSKQAGKRRNHQ